jgi:hypothetical protein
VILLCTTKTLYIYAIRRTACRTCIYTQLLLLLLPPRYWRCARFDIVREIAGIRCCVTGALMMKTTPIDVPRRHIIHSRKLFVWGAVVVVVVVESSCVEFFSPHTHTRTQIACGFVHFEVLKR